MLERLQKILSRAGVASRRKAEELIVAGKVTVNGEVAKLGQRADGAVDRITVDGKVLTEAAEPLYYLLHKPVGYITTNLDEQTWKAFQKAKKSSYSSQRINTLEQEKRTKKHAVGPKKIEKTVRELLPAELRGKIFPVGRLDKDSSGLLLLTSDGQLAHRLMHPSFDHEKEYEVTLARPVSRKVIAKLEKGILIKGEQTKPASVQQLSDTKLRIALTEGKKRQIRRMLGTLGSKVVSLQRIRIVNLSDPHLRPGELRALTSSERDRLLQEIYS